MLRVEDVRGGRVVDNDGILQVPTNLRQVLWLSVTALKQGLGIAYLDVVSLVVVATFTEKAVVHDAVDIELVEKWVTVLLKSALRAEQVIVRRTFETDAVKTTTSYSSPTRFMNWSTPGRLMT